MQVLSRHQQTILQLKCDILTQQSAMSTHVEDKMEYRAERRSYISIICMNIRVMCNMLLLKLYKQPMLHCNYRLKPSLQSSFIRIHRANHAYLQNLSFFVNCWLLDQVSTYCATAVYTLHKEQQVIFYILQGFSSFKLVSLNLVLLFFYIMYIFIIILQQIFLCQTGLHFKDWDRKKVEFHNI